MLLKIRVNELVKNELFLDSNMLMVLEINMSECGQDLLIPYYSTCDENHCACWSEQSTDLAKSYLFLLDLFFDQWIHLLKEKASKWMCQGAASSLTTLTTCFFTRVNAMNTPFAELFDEFRKDMFIYCKFDFHWKQMNSLLKMLVNEFGQELLYGLQSVFCWKQ